MICVVWQDYQGKKLFYPGMPSPLDPSVNIKDPRSVEKWQVRRAFAASLILSRTCSDVQLQEVSAMPDNTMFVRWEDIMLSVVAQFPMRA